jgi:hypothetical protein
MWLPWKPGGDEEAGLKLGRLKPGQGRGPRRLVPWWVGALRRAKAASVMRRQPKTSAGGGGLRRRVGPARLYGRRSVVKASFRRNRGKGGWVRHARYLARERAQHEHDRGRGWSGSRLTITTPMTLTSTCSYEESGKTAKSSPSIATTSAAASVN